MNYRDDCDALRSEVETLQQELDAARADGARLHDIDKRLEAARREVRALETELGRARRKPNSATAVLLAVGMMFVGAGVIGLLAIRRTAPNPVPMLPPPIVTADDPPGAVIPPVAPPVPLPPIEAAPLKTVKVTWSATVTKSTDAIVHAGALCKIDANAVPDSSGMHVIDVTVTCAGRVIYDENGHLEGMSMRDSGARQHAGAKAGTWVYDVIYSDVGARAETRNQAKLDSTLKIGRVWSENMPDFRIDLAIRAGSDPVGVAILEQ